MFSGIIQAIAPVKKSQRHNGSLLLTIQKPAGWKIRPGDSIATNGVCLTAATVTSHDYTVELMPETLRLTTFGKMNPPVVNLEPSLKLADAVAGHLVYGHVGTIGTITEVKKQNRAAILTVGFPKKFSSFVVSQGSIALDGVGLTVVACSPGRCSVSLVDYTLRHTTLGRAQKGDRINIEFDMLAKYVANILQNKK